MKTRTLVANQRYFGLEPLILQRGAERVLARIAGQTAETPTVNVETLREDFQLNPADARKLLQTLVGHRLLEAHGPNGEYRLTVRFREFATARVVPPLTRTEAKELIDRACESAAQLNADVRNPLLVDMMAVSGGYMTSSEKIGKLLLWPVVKRRDRAKNRSLMTDSEGADRILVALRELSPIIVVRIVSDSASVDRPFSVPFHAGTDMPPESPPGATVWEWLGSFRRQLAGH